MGSIAVLDLIGGVALLLWGLRLSQKEIGSGTAKVRAGLGAAARHRLDARKGQKSVHDTPPTRRRQGVRGDASAH